jgi:hypothetical protein
MQEPMPEKQTVCPFCEAFLPLPLADHHALAYRGGCQRTAF